MYIYLDNSSVSEYGVPTLAAVMPTTRGPNPKNHYKTGIVVTPDIEFLGASISPETFQDCKTAAKIKAAVARDGQGGPLPEMTEQYTNGLLWQLVGAFANVLTAAGYTEEANSMLDAGTTARDDNTQLLSVIGAYRAQVSKIMTEMRSGWRRGDEFKAAVAEPKTNEHTAVVTKPAAKPEAGAHGVFFPTVDETYLINDRIGRLFNLLENAVKTSPQNVALIGPHGCGKTELAMQFAARTNKPMLIMDCANLREPRDWFGSKGAKDGTVYWNESQFVRALEAGDHVILLDELNRANPSLLNTLMPLLDDRRFTYLEEKNDTVRVGTGTVFFATMNEGAGYTGTSSLDRAVRDRFPRAVELTYLTEKEETTLLTNRTGVNKDIAKRLVQLANKVRQDSQGMTASLTESISTRQLIAAARDFVFGGVETLEFTITNHFSDEGDDDSERARVQSIIQGKFGDIMAAAGAEATTAG